MIFVRGSFLLSMNITEGNCGFAFCESIPIAFLLDIYFVSFLLQPKVLAELVEMEISTSATLAQEVRSRVSPVWFLGLQHSSLCPSADSCFCCQELEKKAFYSSTTLHTLIFSYQLSTNHVCVPPFPSMPNPIALFPVQIPVTYR